MHENLFDLGQRILFWCILVQVVLVFRLDICFRSVPLYLYGAIGGQCYGIVWTSDVLTAVHKNAYLSFSEEN